MPGGVEMIAATSGCSPLVRKNEIAPHDRLNAQAAAIARRHFMNYVATIARRTVENIVNSLRM